MFTASVRAIEKLREQLVSKCSQADIGFRVDISTDASGGETFRIMIDRQQPGDEVIESEGIKIFVGPASASQINGYSLDYQGDAGGGFSMNKMQEANIERK